MVLVEVDIRQKTLGIAVEGDSPAAVDSPVVEGGRSSGEGADRSFEVVEVRNPAAVDSPRGLVPGRMTSSGATVRPEEAPEARPVR